MSDNDVGPLAVVMC